MKRFSDAFFQAVQGIFRNSLITLVSVIIMVSCLLFAGTFALIGANVKLNLGAITDLNVIEVFVEDGDLADPLSPDAGAETRDVRNDRIRAEIEALTEKDAIEEITFISKDSGVDSMKKTLGDYAYLLDEISEEENPLPDTFEVRCAEGGSVSSLACDVRLIEGVRSVRSRDDLAAKIRSLQNGVSVVFVWMTVLCVIVSLFVIMNTTRLAVFSRKDEIEIMRYIGASRSLIAEPFVLEGLLIGCFSAGLALLLERVIYAALTDFASRQMGSILTELYAFGDLAPMLAAIFFGVAVFCGVVGSLLSIGKYAEA